MNISMIPIEKLLPDPNNPRTNCGEQRAELVASLKAFGVKVPLIGYVVPGGVMIGDGHRRLAVALEAGLRELPVIVFPQKPDEGDLLCVQLTVNGHRASLNPVEEWQAFSRLQQLKGWSASELAAGLAITSSEVTRVMSLAKLSPAELELVRQGKISKSGAYALSRMPPEQRLGILQKAASGEITRDQLNCEARRKRAGDAVKTRRVSCPIAGGTVSVQSEAGLNLANLIELLESLVRECRRSRSQGLDISTCVRVLRDKSRVSSVS